MTDTQTKYDLFFQRGLLLDVIFEGIFFLHGSNIVGIIYRFSFFRPSARSSVGKGSELETVVAVYLQNRSHKPLCNIYETALITDCFNCLPFLSTPLVWKLDATQ